MKRIDYGPLDGRILDLLGVASEPVSVGRIQGRAIRLALAESGDRGELEHVVYQRLVRMEANGLVVQTRFGWMLPASAPKRPLPPIETHGITREEFVKVMAMLAPLVVDEGQGTHVVRNGSPREITAAIYEIAKRIRDSRAPRGEPYGWVVGGSERRRAETLYAQEPNAALLARMDVRHPERAPHLATPLALYYSGEGL